MGVVITMSKMRSSLLLSVYSINSLGWLYHIVNGSNPKDSQIPGELTRIQANMKKVKGLKILIKIF